MDSKRITLEDVEVAPKEETKEVKKPDGYSTPPAIDPDSLSQSQFDRFFGWKKEITKKHLESQPKVDVMIPLMPGEKDGTVQVVMINGYRFSIKKNAIVKVPLDVARMIQDSTNLTLHAGDQALLDNLSNKIDPMTGEPKSGTALGQ